MHTRVSASPRWQLLHGADCHDTTRYMDKKKISTFAHMLSGLSQLCHDAAPSEVDAWASIGKLFWPLKLTLGTRIA